MCECVVLPDSAEKDSTCLASCGEVVAGDFSTAAKACGVQLTWIGVQVGLAYCDNTLKVIGVVEFLDGDQLCNLEAALVRLGARECVAVEDKVGGAKTIESKKIKEVLQRCDVVLTQRKSSDFSTKDIEQDLARLLGSDASKRILQLESQQAMGAAACLVKYLDLLADEGLHGKFKLRELALDGHMKLDRAAVRALNLFPQPQEGNRNMSLYSLLNKCKTPIGSRLLLRWIKQPLVDKSELEARLDLVGLLMEQVQVRQALQVCLCVFLCVRGGDRALASGIPSRSISRNSRKISDILGARRGLRAPRAGRAHRWRDSVPIRPFGIFF